MSYSKKFDEAVQLAVESFRDEHRKGGDIPYITHLFAVTATVGEAGGDEEQMIAAVLHDYLEDIEGASADDLEGRFGPRVRRMVEALSDSDTHPKKPWDERKQTYIQALRSEPSDVKLVSCADKLHNINSILRDLEVMGRRVFERFSEGETKQLWYYRSVVEALEEGWRDPPPLLDELKSRVARVHQRVAELPEPGAP